MGHKELAMTSVLLAEIGGKSDGLALGSRWVHELRVAEKMAEVVPTQRTS